MSQTENQSESPAATPPTDEQIRKVYAKDLKSGETVHTVFRAARKEKAHSRAGKGYLALTLTDRTGAVDGRVFENVEAADAAFVAGDYLLLKGRVGHFHGKLQIVIEQLERLDPEPIDAKEFDFNPPPAPAEEKTDAKAEVRADSKKRSDDESGSHKAARARLLRLLDNPTIALGLDALWRELEKQLEERVVARLSGTPLEAANQAAGVAPTGKGPRVERRQRPNLKHDGPRPESGKTESGKTDAKLESPQRDPSLPEGIAFKPFKALVGEGENSSSGS